MKQQAANLMRRLVSMVLAIGLSLCCCQTHLLFAGPSHRDAPVAAAVDSCCESCPADAPDRERPAPAGCRTCCIKGTGLKDPTTLAQPAAELLLTLTLPTVVVTPAAPASPSLVARVDATRLRVEPRTLVRLRCAMIV